MRILLILAITLQLFAFDSAAVTTKGSVVEKNGALSVKDGQIVNQDGEAISISGPSLFWSNNGYEGELFYSADTVAWFKEDWNATLIRAAMAAQGKGSYIDSADSNRNKVETVVDAAIANGLYVIVDWHSHKAEQHLEQSVAFFQYMATKYGKTDNIIYEIYNEPLRDTDWADTVKPYSETVIAAIREIDPDNLIIVGTQSWSQYVDVAAKDPIKNNHNIAYSLHFYAGTHKADLRARAQTALDLGVALFVSEWGSVNANGDGAIDRESTEQWLAFMKKNKLSHTSWSVTNKKENSAFIKPDVTTNSGWSDEQLTENGRYLKKIISRWND